MCCCLFGGGGVKSKTGLGLVSSIEQNPNPFQPTKKSPVDMTVAAASNEAEWKPMKETVKSQIK
jgi:hypothetical protein